MNATNLAMLAGGLATGAFAFALWSILRGFGRVLDLANHNEELES